MGGIGVEQRMKILRQAAEQQMLKPLQTHGWSAAITAEAEQGEYLVVRAEKAGAEHKVALLYTSATANSVYKHLDTIVEHIFTNGELYKIESYAYGIAVPVQPIDEFFPLLVAWNQKLAPGGDAARRRLVRPSTVRHITSEDPLAGIWLRLDQFQSVRLAAKLVARRAAEGSVELTEAASRSKAEGVSYSIRNASDYFRRASGESLNKRILSFYYGSLSLAFAEMLASPAGPIDLDELEGMTKQGHGLYTLTVGETLGDLWVGALDRGFFPQWALFLGHDVSAYPKKKPKGASDIAETPPNTVLAIPGLFGRLPEIDDLFAEVFDLSPSWFVPLYDTDSNPSLVSLWKTERPKQDSTYLNLLDPSGRTSVDAVKASPWGFVELTVKKADADGKWYRARLDHAGFEYWHEALPIHHSPFLNRASIILPIFGSIGEYRVIGFTILYALSILVRYMPSLWRRIEGGDADEHLAVVQATLDVLERVLPEEFLESILRERVHVRQPGRMF